MIRRITIIAMVASMVTVHGARLPSDEKPLPPSPVKPASKDMTKVHIPVLPVLVEPDADPVPVPAPDKQSGPVPVSELSEDTWYVIESEFPLIVLTSPAGLVGVSHEDGPVKVRGKFADGTGRTETRVFKSKHCYFVNALKAGTVELLIVPVGVTEESEVLRQQLKVLGETPRPPPVPVPDPNPLPPPVPTPTPEPKPATGLRVLLLTNETASRDQLNTVNSTKIVEWLNTHCARSEDGRAEWRRWDRTSVSKPNMLEKEAPIWRKLWNDISEQLPEGNLLIVVTDTKVSIQPLANPEATLDLLNKIKEGR